MNEIKYPDDQLPFALVKKTESRFSA